MSIFEPKPPPPIGLSPVWLTIAAVTVGGVLLSLLGVRWGILLAGLGLLGFIVTAWRRSHPRGGVLHPVGGQNPVHLGLAVGWRRKRGRSRLEDRRARPRPGAAV